MRIHNHGTPFQKPLEAAFRRLTGQLDQTVRFSMGNVEQVLSFRPFAPDDADLKIFEVLTRALRERRVLKLLYRNRGAEAAQQREVRPYHVACVNNHWYLLAFDLKRDEMRTFSLTRMQKAELGRKRFTMPAGFGAQEYLRDSFGVFKGDPEGDYEVVVDFDARAADEIRGRRLYGSQQMTELPKGLLRLRIRLNNLEEVERWLLSFGTHATWRAGARYTLATAGTILRAKQANGYHLWHRSALESSGRMILSALAALHERFPDREGFPVEVILGGEHRAKDRGHRYHEPR